MNNFARAHNSYLEPPDDDPVCENGCGETLVREWTGRAPLQHVQTWVCRNKFCPLKFQGVEQEMAYKLVETLQDLELARFKIRNTVRGV